MYYEEKIDNGVLYFRNNPLGEWKVATSQRAEVINYLYSLPPDQRLSITHYFCSCCGELIPCDCWEND